MLGFVRDEVTNPGFALGAKLFQLFCFGISETATI
jgi:hypothetical protein